MHYPVQLTQISKEIQLFVPDPEQVKEIYQQSLEQDPATLFPFWARIWPSALALARFLKEESHWVKDKRVLEIGAGLGMPSFSIAAVTKELLISDNDPDAVALLHKNINHLRLAHTQALQLDWNQLPQLPSIDIVLLSDVNYEPAAFPALLKSIESLLRQGITILLATPQRLLAVPFAEAIFPWVILSRTISVTQSGETAVSIFVLAPADPNKQVK